MKRVAKILEEASKSGDRKLARSLRKAALEGINEMAKEAQSKQTGIFQVFRDGITEYPTRENKLTGRGGTHNSEELYGLGPDHKKMDSSRKPHDRSLSTRYSPDRPGVQARRLADGVYQDPYTNKIYDWNEGFSTEDGQKFEGGHVALQTDLYHT